jgi:hypothetical protein
MCCQFDKPGIWHDPWLVECCRASRNQDRVEHIVLGTAQMHPAKRLDLDRLQYQHGKTRRTQMCHHAALVSARGLDADAGNTRLGQLGHKSLPAS